MRTFPLPLILCCVVTGIFAQEQLSWRLDNYAGINSAFYNPAAPANSPLGWDINLLEISHYSDNNYAYLDNTSGLKALKMLRNWDAENFYFFRVGRIPNDFDYKGKDVLLYNYFEGDRGRYGYTHTAALGPSLSFRLAGGTSLGLFTRARVLASAIGLDGDLSYYTYNYRPYGETFIIDPVEVGLGGWTEIGLNLAQAIPTATGRFNIGVSARRLSAYQSVYLRNDFAFDYAKVAMDSIQGENFRLSGGMTDDWLDLEGDLSSNGNGWAVDLGIQYLAGMDDEGNYLWKFGLALLDLGQLSFTKNAQYHVFEDEDLRELDGNPYRQFEDQEDLPDIARAFSQDVFGDPTLSLRADRFSIGLPSAISGQIEYAFSPNIFLSANYIGGFGNKQGLARGQLLSFTPRYESRWLGVAVPLSLYQWQQPQLGLALRLGPLVLGSERLGSLLVNQKLTGTDFYLALKLFPPGFGKDGGQKRAFSRGKAGKGRDIKCYRF